MKFKHLFILTVFVVLIAASSCVSQGVYYFVEVEEEINDNHLGLNEYYAVHHLYSSLFQKVDFVEVFDTYEKAAIIKKFLYNFSFKNPVYFVIEDPATEEKAILFAFLHKSARKKTITVMTNIDKVTGEILEDNELRNKAFKQEYRIFDSIVVNISESQVADLVETDEEEEVADDEEIEEEVLERPRDYQNLAEEFLFDRDTENDARIEDLLIEAIDRGDLNTKFISRLTYARYYLSTQDFDSAEVQLENAAELVNNNEDHDFTGFLDSFVSTIEEFAILKMIVDGDV